MSHPPFSDRSTWRRTIHHFISASNCRSTGMGSKQAPPISTIRPHLHAPGRARVGRGDRNTLRCHAAWGGDSVRLSRKRKTCCSSRRRICAVSTEDGEEAPILDEDFKSFIQNLEAAQQDAGDKLEYGIEDFEKYSTGVGFEDDDDSANVGPDHRSGYIALVGLPNVGKSTLLNSLVGQKLSIVTRKAQTTRHRIRGLVSREDSQLIFFDTPGIITRFKTKLDEKMMGAIRQAVDESDAVLMMVDSTDDPKADIEMIQPPKNWKGPPMAVLLNKADLITHEEQEELKEWYERNCRVDKVFLTNANLGEGVDDVKEWALQQMPLGPPLYPKSLVTEQPERFFVTEIIREKIFLQYRQEIPYSIQVNVVEFTERPGQKKDFISVEVVVERPLQRAIILGKGGTAIKQLATAARADIEEFLGRPVFLKMDVVVIKDWRKDAKLLQRYGY
ncbi:hypothetical protein BSKO_07690 [Bryopsis sp. KO-2023]|nr:hypothetical protein BSKO_07690 [Bryopsis sp. KO-2023]